MSLRYSLAELENAINFWRARSPATGEELALCPQAAALAEPYAQLIMEHKGAIEASDLSAPAVQALEEWRRSAGG